MHAPERVVRRADILGPRVAAVVQLGLLASAVWLGAQQAYLAAVPLGLIALGLLRTGAQVLDQVELDGQRLWARRLWSRARVAHRLDGPLAALIRVEPVRPDAGGLALRPASVQLLFPETGLVSLGPEWPQDEVAALLEHALRRADGVGWPVQLGDAPLVRWEKTDDPKIGTIGSYVVPALATSEAPQAVTLYVYEPSVGRVEPGLEGPRFLEHVEACLAEIRQVCEHPDSPWDAVEEIARGPIGEGNGALLSVVLRGGPEPVTTQLCLAGRGDGRAVKVRASTPLDPAAHETVMAPLLAALTRCELR